MTDQIVYPISLEELTKLRLEYGSRLHIQSIGDDGVATIGADEAMMIACDAVAIGASDLMMDRFNNSFLDPIKACKAIASRAEKAFERATAARAASADRTAEIYAARFGITEPRTAPSGRA